MTPVAALDKDLASVPALVRRWSDETPHAVAVRAGSRELTYHELAAISDRLANRLARLGLPAGSTVAARLDRGVELPAVLLGIMAAGHAWICLDPATDGVPDCPLAAHVVSGGDPATDGLDIERRPGSTGDGPAGRTDDGVAGSAGDGPAGRTEDGSAGDGQVGSTVDGDDADAPAGLVPATVGDGLRASAAVTRGALAGLLLDLGARLGIRPGDRLLSLAPSDVAHGPVDLCLPLVHGGELVIATEAEARDLPKLVGLLDRWQPRFAHATPYGWQNLINVGWTGGPHVTVVSSGDPLPARLADRLAGMSAAVWNAYGLPATAGYATLHRLTGPVEEDHAPIGQPLDGLVAHVLDDDLQPVGDGEVGELCLGGPWVGPGYPAQPGSRTARSYRPDPWADRPGGRLLRTGDLVRRRADGVMLFRGRVAERVPAPTCGDPAAIDPVAVEGEILRLDGIEQCAVTVAEDDPRLVAHVVVDAARGYFAGLEEAATQVRARVPVLAKVICYHHLPLARDGRVDKAALRAHVEATRPVSGRPPQTHEERLIAAIWVDLLGIPQPPADVSFFDVGGYSLAVTRLANRLEQAFAMPVPLAELFVQNTVATQAALVERLYIERLADLTEVGGDEGGWFIDSVPSS